MKFFLIALGIASGLFISCERQEFEGPGGTKQLHEPHGGKGTAHGADHPSEGATSHEEPKPSH